MKWGGFLVEWGGILVEWGGLNEMGKIKCEIEVVWGIF